MMKDKDLEALFLANKPKFEDGDAFMASLNKRLDAVEYLRQYEVASKRRYRLCMVAAFFCGIICGGFMLVFLLCTPSQLPLFTFNVQAGIMTLIAQNSLLIASIFLSLLMVACAIGIISLINDINPYLENKKAQIK